MMKLSFLEKKSLRIFLVLGIFVILGIFIIPKYFFNSPNNRFGLERVGADIDFNVRGWTWGENMGWISANCHNDFTAVCVGGIYDGEPCTQDGDCEGGGVCSKDGTFENCCPGGSTCPSGMESPLYGLVYDTQRESLRGYAWSDKVGWVCFGRSCKCADCSSCEDYVNCTGCSGCPEPEQVNPPGGWPFSWACVGEPSWYCDGGANDGQSCSKESSDCPDGLCIFGCSGDGGEDFLDINRSGSLCYSVTNETLKAHWKMNSGGGEISAALADNSSFGNDFSIGVSPSLAKGKFDDALQFNGENSYLYALDSPSLSISDNLTIEAWVKRGEINREQTILSKWDESTGEKSYRLWFDQENKLNFSVGNGGEEATVKQRRGLCFGGVNQGEQCSSDEDCEGKGAFCRNALITDVTKWHHLTGKYITATSDKDAFLQIFIDGLSVSSEILGEIPSFLEDLNNDFYLGAKKGSSGQMDSYFTGLIDNVSLWTCNNIGLTFGRSARDVWADAKIEVSGWAKVINLENAGWLNLRGATKQGKIWGIYLNNYSPFYTMGGYMANRHADTTMDSEGLVGNWMMDEPSWSTNTGSSIPVVDSSGEGNQGIASGASPNSDGLFNNAGQFDGLNDYIEIADSEKLDFNDAESFTIQFWVKPMDFFKTSGSLPIVKRNSGPGYEIGLDYNGGISWYLRDEANSKADTPDSNYLTLNTWNHVAVVFDRAQGTITRYLDGEVTGSVDSFGEISDLSNNLSLSIGGRFLRGDSYFRGLIDNVSIYEVARTPTQVLRDYQKQDPYCVGWGDNDHDYGDPPEPADFNSVSVTNTEGCEQLLIQWESSDWAESYTYHRCDNVEASDCATCSYVEYNVLSGEEFNVQDVGLSSDTGYCYKIEAHNETGSTYNSEGPVWQRTTLCSPENVEIDDNTCGEIEVYWDLSETASGYNIYNSLSTAEDFAVIGHLGEAMDYTNLTAHWKMNEEDWDGTSEEVKDSSGSDSTHHGTSFGATPNTNGLFNNAGEFNGTSNYIIIPNSEEFDSETITLQAWVKRSSAGTRDVIFSDNKDSEDDINRFLRWEIGSDDLLALIFGDGVTEKIEIKSDTLIDDTDWHHLVAIRNHQSGQGTVTFYIDGLLDKTSSYILDSIAPLSTNDLLIGASNGGSPGYFHGLIDNLSFYDAIRSQESVRVDYEAGDCGQDNCSLTEVCHVLGVEDNNCGKGQDDSSVCCYTDQRILPYVDYYYQVTAVTDAGESPSSSCEWEDCPGGLSSCCPWGNTICFPPAEIQEE
ncbi:hypothetical protein K9K85_01680 [Patescibacteria group bacterium]|nr:hypothetical protein [Patescibacteria group bacterium]